MRLIPKPETIEKPVETIVKQPALPTPSEVIQKRVEAQSNPIDEYGKEQQLLLAHKLLIRRATTTQIAEKLDITVAEASALIKEVKTRYAEFIRKQDPMEMVAEGLYFYDEIIAESMRIYDGVRNTGKAYDKVRALEMALKARVEKDKFLVNVGILNNNQNTEHVKEDHHTAEATAMKELLADIINVSAEELHVNE